MKNQKKIITDTQPLKNVLAMSVATIMTSMICLSTMSYASDIEIYQEAKSGSISLMLLLDMSGSMSNSGSYDKPSNVSCSTTQSIPFNDTTNGISYTKQYCRVDVNNRSGERVYYFKRTGSSGNRVWYSCGALGSVNQSDCTILLASSPSTTGHSDTGDNPRYYYKDSVTTTGYYRRVDRVRDAIYQLLYGPNAIGGDKYLGVSTYPRVGNQSALVQVPVRRLDEVVSGTKTHRQFLMETVAGLSTGNGTPTAQAYAEVGAYMMGQKTSTLAKYIYYTTGTGYGQTTGYRKCEGWNESQGVGSGSCTSFGSLQSSRSNILAELDTSSCTLRSGSTSYTGTCHIVAETTDTGFAAAEASLRNGFNYKLPNSLQVQTTEEGQETKTCSGQGIYVLTDGDPNSNEGTPTLMKNALGSAANLGESAFSCTNNDSGWDCVTKFNRRLLNTTANPNPLDLTLKTAVIGFGNAYNSITSYNKNLTEQENIDALGSIDSNQKRAAEWGIRGRGGWYSGNSTQDIIDSVNEFINSLSTEIPAVTTGVSTIPLDQLNPSVLQNFAYYPQFQPTPDKSYQLWAGNLKKYKVTESGTLVDKNDDIFVDQQGRILDNYDLWSADVVSGVNQDDENILGSDKNRLIGGLKSRLKLQANTDGTVKRKLLTDRSAMPISGAYTSMQQLRALDLSLVSSSDPTRGYLLSLLGYRVNPTKPDEITTESLGNASELRQVGAVMHSSPILLTNKGKIQYNSTSNTVGSDNREDYILFGTTQGLLHVVDVTTGEEKFAFLPNVMVEDQKEAFANFDTTIGGMDQLYYGVDGPWTAHTEYVTAANDMLTVGTGLNNQVGKQIVYGGLRMGGRNYYALDLADIESPQLKFVISPSGECSSNNPLGCMGQSWSKPTITYVNWKGTKKLVMLVGGGYDAQGLPSRITSMPENTAAQISAKQAAIKHYRGYEYDDYAQINKIGAGVYMFDALNGDLLWWTGANTENPSNHPDPTYVPVTGAASTYHADMKYSVVSQIKAIDRDADGLSDHFYFGDLGGQVWRIDYNNSKLTNENLRVKKPIRLLNLNDGKGSPRFYETPAFSTYIKNGKVYGVVSIGSGNRSQPLAEYSTDSTDYAYDGVFNIYDKDVARQDLFTVTTTGADQTYNTFSPLTADITLVDDEDSPTGNLLVELTDDNRFSNDNLLTRFEDAQGWYYLFKSNLKQSEKVMSTPLVINNDMFVTTFDGSKDGMSGDCGAGVKGESFMTLFCMPYGQCNGGSVSSYRLNLGAGIVGGAVGAGDGTGMQRLIVANVDTSGIIDNAILNKRYRTENKLTPQRWYERR